MWQKPWGYKEGFAICGGLFLTGTFLQITIGKCELSILSYPMNVCVGVLYLVILLLIYAFSQKSYFIRWMGSCQAAVSSMVSVAMLTVVMGLIRQVKSDVPLLGAESWLGFSQMLSACSFVLLFLWMITLLGLTTIRRIHHFRWCDFPFVLNHLGLFLALTGAILGNADMERLRMTTKTGQAMVSGKAMPLFENNVKKNIAGMSDGSAAEGSIEMEYVFLPVPVMDNVTESCYGTTDGMVVLRNNNTTEEHLKNVCEFMAFLCTGERVAAVDNELYLSCVCESGRTAQESYELDQSELNAKATEREISLVVAPPTGITAEMSANAKTIMDEVIAPKFQSLLAGETDAQSVYDAVCTAAKEAFGEENCASGWIQ